MFNKSGVEDDGHTTSIFSVLNNKHNQCYYAGYLWYKHYKGHGLKINYTNLQYININDFREIKRMLYDAIDMSRL